MMYLRSMHADLYVQPVRWAARLALTFVSLALADTSGLAFSADEVDFEKDIAPILIQNASSAIQHWTQVAV